VLNGLITNKGGLIMAHDNQYKEAPEGVKIKRYDYPVAGELYWNRYTRSVETASQTLNEMALILVRED